VPAVAVSGRKAIQMICEGDGKAFEAGHLCALKAASWNDTFDSWPDTGACVASESTCGI